jgi:hypothetical protein
LILDNYFPLLRQFDYFRGNVGELNAIPFIFLQQPFDRFQELLGFYVYISVLEALGFKRIQARSLDSVGVAAGNAQLMPKLIRPSKPNPFNILY